MPCSIRKVIRDVYAHLATRLQKVEAVPHGTNEVGDVFEDIVCDDGIEVIMGKVDSFGNISYNVWLPARVYIYV